MQCAGFVRLSTWLFSAAVTKYDSIVELSLSIGVREFETIPTLIYELGMIIAI